MRMGQGADPWVSRVEQDEGWPRAAWPTQDADYTSSSIKAIWVKLAPASFVVLEDHSLLRSDRGPAKRAKRTSSIFCTALGMMACFPHFFT